MTLARRDTLSGGTSFRFSPRVRRRTTGKSQNKTDKIVDAGLVLCSSRPNLFFPFESSERQCPTPNPCIEISRTGFFARREAERIFAPRHCDRGNRPDTPGFFTWTNDDLRFQYVRNAVVSKSIKLSVVRS